MITAANGIAHAYREVGDGAPPLVVLQHFRAAHGFLFQHQAEFAGDVHAFLAA